MWNELELLLSTRLGVWCRADVNSESLGFKLLGALVSRVGLASVNASKMQNHCSLFEHGVQGSFAATEFSSVSHARRLGPLAP